jgi:hypothetical protein
MIKLKILKTEHKSWCHRKVSWITNMDHFHSSCRRNPLDVVQINDVTSNASLSRFVFGMFCITLASYHELVGLIFAAQDPFGASRNLCAGAPSHPTLIILTLAGAPNKFSLFY